jgi:PAS domain S-box-containing protein
MRFNGLPGGGSKGVWVVPDEFRSVGTFPAGAGELATLIRQFDWTSTSLGPLSAWPQSLKSVTQTLLHSPVPIVLLWGADGIMIYNDAYSVFAGGRHPRLLGSKVRDGWAEIADFNDNVMKVGLSGRTLAYKDQELTLHRNGRPEQVWMNLDYSPVLDEAGEPAGVIAIVVETTERVMAERRVAESEARFRALVNATSDIVYRMSPDWRLMQQLDGRGFLADTALPRVEWMEEYVLPEDRPAVTAAIRTAMDGKSVYRLEHRVKRLDGTTGWVASRAIPLTDDRGEIVEWFGAATDISGTVLARDLLQESEERFRLIADSAPVPMWVTKLDRTRSFANQAYLDFVGADYERAIAFDWRTILHPDDLSRIVMESVAGEAALRPFVLEGRYRRADGAWRWMRSESQPRWDPQGKHIGFIGVAHDITTAKEAEGELRRLNETLEQRITERTSQLESNEAQLRAILETSNQYQGLLDLGGNVLYLNRTALSGIQATAADLIGKPFWDSPWFSATPGAPGIVADTFAAVTGGESMRTEMLLHLPAGERYFDFAMRPVFDRHGAIASVLSEAVDITDRRRAEEALRQSQKMEAVGQLTGGVAHDFNNLLTIIRSATDFLRRRELPEERRKRYVEAISDTVDRASKLTGQLLAFARRQPLTPQVFGVDQQVEGIAQLLRPLVGSRIEIKLRIHDTECFALADIAQFETALINLAVNSRDAMDGEGVISIDVSRATTIPASATSERRKGDFIAISITDTGTGIAPDQIAVIFEPFFTTKEVGKGTGLGLSQAVGFAKQSGGEIVVISALGKGSTFTIYLPQAEAPITDADADAAPGHFDLTPSGRGHRILLVEDNKNVGKVSNELLQDLGYATEWADNARAALDLLAENQRGFDLVFSDVIMPGMNGVELATIIRKQYPHLPVVLTSGYSSALAESAHHGFELIQKPYSVEALSRTLRKAIQERPATN